MMTRTGLLIGLLALMSAGPAFAQPAWYLGGTLGQGRVDASLSDFAALDDGSIIAAELDDSTTSGRLFAGVRLDEHVGVELGYSEPGEIAIDATSDGSGTLYVAGPVTYTAEASGVELTALAGVPVGAAGEVYLRAGVFQWDADATLSNGGVSGSASDDGTDPTFGVGYRHDLDGRLAVRFAWQRYSDVSDADIDTYGLGLALGF